MYFRNIHIVFINLFSTINKKRIFERFSYTVIHWRHLVKFNFTPMVYFHPSATRPHPSDIEGRKIILLNFVVPNNTIRKIIYKILILIFIKVCHININRYAVELIWKFIIKSFNSFNCFSFNTNQIIHLEIWKNIDTYIIITYYYYLLVLFSMFFSCRNF